MNKHLQLEVCEELANRIRVNSLKMAHRAGHNGAHMGSNLCIVDILAAVYGGVLNFDPTEPTWKGRDRFILTKGHGYKGLFAANEAVGVI